MLKIPCGYVIINVILKMRYHYGRDSMRFIIVPNTLKEKATECASFLAETIKSKGHTCLEFTDFKQRVCDEQDRKEIQKCDMVIVIGGDGTVLRTIRLLTDFDIPVWGINFGRVGYLTDCQPDNLPRALDKILSGQYRVENRITLGCDIVGSKENLLAFNEVVLHRASVSRALKIDLKLGGELTARIHADGIIAATPTGSTAYNLSAGGMVLPAEATDVQITSICPAPGEFVTQTVSSQEKIEFVVHLPSLEGDDKDDTPLIVLDGLKKYHLSDNEQVKIYKSDILLRLVRTEL